MTSDNLTQAEGNYLVKLARATLEEALGNGSPQRLAPPPTQRLHAPGAAFVTLHTKSKTLRGCIGSLSPRRPLIEDVRSNTIAAAFEDPRFPPLTAQELPEILVEVSVLTSPKPLAYESAEDLLTKLRPEIDGVVIEQGWHRATFLPQVWEQIPNPKEFLGHLCHKAGLLYDAWKETDLSVSTYQVQKYEEPPM